MNQTCEPSHSRESEPSHSHEGSDKSFCQRFSIIPKNQEIRNRIIESGNARDFFIEQSCVAHQELGLFANRNFKKGDFLGTYRGEICLISDLKNAFSGLDQYNSFLKTYNITTKLVQNETCSLMEKLGFVISNTEFLVMPKYPLEPIFYQTYNAMLYVNEPSNTSSVWNEHLNQNQKCEINVLAYTNFKWNTIDYIASKDIPEGTELLVYYGDKYNRVGYEINIRGCNQLDNEVFFT
jgi:hypothetical protein